MAVWTDEFQANTINQYLFDNFGCIFLSRQVISKVSQYTGCLTKLNLQQTYIRKVFLPWGWSVVCHVCIAIKWSQLAKRLNVVKCISKTRHEMSCWNYICDIGLNRLTAHSIILFSSVIVRWWKYVQLYDNKKSAATSKW